MKLNLGCGRDVRPGYTNVDIHGAPGIVVADLSVLPWPWENGSVSEVLMLDFLEHFEYRKTEPLLQEVWRILEPAGVVEIQVPDLQHCARAASFEPPFMCNKCGWEFPEEDYRANFFMCDRCGQQWIDIALAATQRLYGGQDYVGNWHFNAFSGMLLKELLHRNGFGNVERIEKNQNGETFYQNWNIKYRATKIDELWSDS